MRLTLLLVSAVALAACSPATPTQAPTSAAAPASAAAQAAPDPADTIRSLYERYFARTETNFPPLLEQAPWSAAMRAKLQTMLQRSEAAQAPILDFDPFINAQDWQLTTLSVTTDAVAPGSHAVARATFDNAGQRQEIIYDLVWENEAWRVDNIRADGWNLVQVAEGNPEP